MPTLQVIVSEKIATYVKRGGSIVCGNSDYKIVFTFDSEWNEHEKKYARFIWNGAHRDVEIVGNECFAPIIKNADEVKVGVYAGDLETTTPAVIPCKKSILCEDVPASTEHDEHFRDEAVAAAERAERAAAEAEDAVAGKSTVIVGGERVSEFDADTKADIEALAGKVDVPKNPGANQALVSRPSGAVELWGMDSTPQAGSIAMYTNRKTMQTETATDGKDAVPLAQMQEALTAKADTATVDTLTKKVENLEAGVAPDMFTADDATAYVKTIPADAAPYAELRSVGGMVHVVSGNLYDANALSAENGKSYDSPDGSANIFVYDDGSIGVSPDDYMDEFAYYVTTAKFKDVFPGAEVGKQYVLTYDAAVDSSAEYGVGLGSIYPSGTFVLTDDIYNGGLTIDVGEAYEQVDTYGIECRYSNITLLEVGKPERVVRETKVTALDIYGKNLYNGGFGGTACTTEENGVVTIVKSAGTGSQDRFTTSWLMPIKTEGWSISVTVNKNTTASGLWYGQEDTNGDTKYGILCQAGVTGRAYVNLQAPTEGANIYKVFLLVNYNEAEGTGVVLTDIMISPTTTDTTYSPYHKHTFAIPEAVQALDGYGWGIPNGAHNGVEWDENGKATFVKRVVKLVFDGTEDWIYADTASADKWRKFVPLQMQPRDGGSGSINPLVCNLYDANTAGKNWYAIKSVATSVSGLYVYDDAYSTKDVSLWKAHLAELYQKGDPLTVYYELAEPIVTDISAYFTEDNLIPVEGGGVIIANNETEEAAPTTIVYQTRDFLASTYDAFDEVHAYAQTLKGGAT